jgi:branched-chain amino acid transport system permease protein
MRRVLPWLAFAMMLALPVLPAMPAYWITLLNYIGLAAMVAIGLVVLTGVGGMTSLGQAMFVGTGAYTTAILTTRYGVSPWVTLPAAILITAVAAWFIGVITLRLSGHYLPLGTLAWNVSLYYTFGNLDFFGRHDGIADIPPLWAFGYSLADGWRIYYLIWILVALMVIATRNLLASRAGRAIRALRGGVTAAQSFGVDTARAKVTAFVYAAVLAAISGWLYAHMQRAVNPTPFNLEASIEYLLMAVIGGAGSVWGAILGAGLVGIIKDQLQDYLPRLIGMAGNFETIAFGLILILILQTAREGLWPLLAGLVTRRWPVPAPRRPAAPALPQRPVPPRGERLLEVAALRKSFGGLVAVRDVSFTLDAGEIVGLIGPNGAGKSTTFNLVTGVAAPSGGEVCFRGSRVVGLQPRRVARDGVGRTFQHVKLVPQMSVIENVAIGAHLRGRAGALEGILRLDRAEEARIFGEARRQLERVGLGEHLYRPATSLALGQQRIVEIARALSLDPVLLLLDEPAAGLRHREKEALADLLRRLQAEGMSILLVEHDMDFVMGVTDRLVVMDFGTKIAEGVPDRVRADPVVVEAYLGSAA